MYKAALQASHLQGKIGATAICNYAIFLYRHKKDPEQAAELFCNGLERFPNHRGIQKNYKAMKRELQKIISQSKQSKLEDHPVQVVSHEKEEDFSRESHAHTAKMAGMRAKLYHDVQCAEDYQLSLEAQSKTGIDNALDNDRQKKIEKNHEEERKGEGKSEEKGNPLAEEDDDEQEEEEEDDDGLFSFTIHQMSCSSLTQLENESHLYWIFNAGSGSISDQSYESGILSLGQQQQQQQQILEWKYDNPVTTGLIDENQSPKPAPPPSASVSCHDHLCFEFYQLKQLNLENLEAKKGQFLGSVLIPIEDLLLMHSQYNYNLPNKNSKPVEQSVEETIMSDDGDVIGQIILRYSLL
jgi:hypothetical protein